MAGNERSAAELCASLGYEFRDETLLLNALTHSSYTNDKGNIMAIPVDKVKEILEKNKRGEQPEKLEDYAVTREQMTNTNEGYSERDLNKMSD